MEGYAAIDNPEDVRSEHERLLDQYHRAEISISGLNASYVFKIRNVVPTSMCVLVRQDSEIVPRLRVGDTFNVKYYFSDSDYPPEHRETEIRNIIRDDEGRFKGHYLVGLEILEGQT